MPTKSLQFEGGDVVIRLGPETTYLLHRDVLINRSAYFAAALSNRWNQPERVLTVEETKTEIWVLDLFVDATKATVDLRIVDHDALAKEHVIENQANARLIEQYGQYHDGEEYKKNTPRYERFLWSTPSANVPKCLYHLEQHYRKIILWRNMENTNQMPKKSEILAREQRIHNAIFAIIYGQEFILSKMACVKAIVDLLADILECAHFYNILAIASQPLEKQFLELPGLWKDVSLHPHFYLGIGYHLRSRDIFIDAMKHLVGRGSLQHIMRNDVGSGFFSEDVFLLEDSLRRELTSAISSCVNTWSKPLSPYQTKVRYTAKSAIMNWIMINILGELHFDAPHGPVIGKIRKLSYAIREMDVSFLGQSTVNKLAASQNIPKDKLIEDIKSQLYRMYNGSPPFMFDHGPNCAHHENDNFYAHSFINPNWLPEWCDLECSDGEESGFHEVEVEPVTQEWLDLVGVKDDTGGWQRLLDEEEHEAEHGRAFDLCTVKPPVGTDDW